MDDKNNGGKNKYDKSKINIDDISIDLDFLHFQSKVEKFNEMKKALLKKPYTYKTQEEIEYHRLVESSFIDFNDKEIMEKYFDQRFDFKEIIDLIDDVIEKLMDTEIYKNTLKEKEILASMVANFITRNFLACNCLKMY